MRLRRMIWIGLLIAVLAGLSGCGMGEKQAPAGEAVSVVSFDFYHSGMSTYDFYAYRVETDEGTGETMVTCEFMNGYETYSLPADEELMQRLMAIIDGHSLRTWDGFKKSNSLVADGEGFGLQVRLTDGTGISASGSNRFPEGYGDAGNAIEELFLGFLKEHGIEPQNRQ